MSSASLATAPSATLEQSDPIAYVELIIGRKGRQWKVLCCPYCGRPHVHGAGAVDSPRPPEAFLGGRLSHCTDRGVGGSYDLVAAPSAGGSL